MSYYVAVNTTGSINATLIRNTLLQMPRIETFAQPIQYNSQGINMYSQVKGLQLIDGEGRLLTAENFVYPAPFRPVAGTIDTKLAVSIAVPIGMNLSFIPF